MKQTMTRRWLLTALLAGVVVPVAACDSIFGTRDRRPDEARVVVTGQSDVPLRLVLSTNFTATQDVETGIWLVDLITAEVHDLPLPMDQTIRLNTDRFFAQLANLSDEVEATVHMEVFFDGRRSYSQQATLVEAQLEFIHLFQ